MSAAIDEVLALVRPDLQAFAGYSSARSAAVQGEVWLNANESAWANAADPAGSSRRYPEPQPLALREGLAALYGVTPQQLLIGRGSDEAIDLLVRALCVPGRDGVLVTPPVFGMYAVCARLQGAALIEVPLVDSEDGLRTDLDAVIDAAKAQGAKLAGSHFYTALILINGLVVIGLHNGGPFGTARRQSLQREGASGGKQY